MKKNDSTERNLPGKDWNKGPSHGHIGGHTLVMTSVTTNADGVATTPIYGVVAHFCSFGIPHVWPHSQKYTTPRSLTPFAYLYIEFLA